MTTKRKSFFEPQFLFLVLSLFAGLICVFFIPIGLGFDEKAHTRRIWEISGGTFMPNFLAEKIKTFPTSMDEKLSIPPFFDDPSHTIFGVDLTQRINWWELGDGKTSSSYFPTLYILPSLVMLFFGRNFNISMMVLFYLLRIACLLGFVIPAFYAVKIIPHSKWLFMGLALVPMSMLQSGTISPEGMSNGLAFLFVAWIIRFSEQEEKLTKGGIVSLLIMIVLLFTLKLNLIFLALLMFLISSTRYKSKKQMAVIWLSIAILFAVIVLGWNYLTASSLPYNGNTPSDVVNQVKFIAAKPLNYLGILVNDLKDNFGKYFMGWIAVFPSQNLFFPVLVHIFYGITILFFILFDPTNKNFSTKKRIILLITGIAGYILTITILFVKDAPVGSLSVLRVQGRYFIVAFALILLGLIFSTIKIPQKVFKPAAIGLMTLVTVLFSAAVILRYSTACGLNSMTGTECFRPAYRNWAPNSVYTEPVKAGTTITQTIQVDCKNLNALRLWADWTGNQGNKSTIFVLRDLNSGDIVTEQTISNKNIPRKDWLTLTFPIVPDSSGREYAITIGSSDATPDDSSRFSLSYRQEYLAGELSINGQPVETDLIFQYGCCVKPFCKVLTERK